MCLRKQVNTLSRAQVSKAYFQHMYNAKIIVTVNPANWEGDFRLWEAMASGALVMVDPIFVPHPHPLLDGKHVIFFSNTNKTSLWEKLDYYIKNPREARQIAIQGYLHAMKYHRTVSMIDYVLRSAHMKRAAIKNTKPFPKYTYTGQYLNVITRRNSVSIKELDRPALFESRSMFNHTHIDE
jgi:spore maturation protein CgeB